MKAVSGKQICKILERHGWVLQRVRGSHHIYARPGSPVIITVPVHGNRDLRVGTVHRILDDAGLTANDL